MSIQDRNVGFRNMIILTEQQNITRNDDAYALEMSDAITVCEEDYERRIRMTDDVRRRRDSIETELRDNIKDYPITPTTPLRTAYIRFNDRIVILHALALIKRNLALCEWNLQRITDSETTVFDVIMDRYMMMSDAIKVYVSLLNEEYDLCEYILMRAPLNMSQSDQDEWNAQERVRHNDSVKEIINKIDAIISTHELRVSLRQEELDMRAIDEQDIVCIHPYNTRMIEIRTNIDEIRELYDNEINEEDYDADRRLQVLLRCHNLQNPEFFETQNDFERGELYDGLTWSEQLIASFG